MKQYRIVGEEMYYTRTNVLYAKWGRERTKTMGEECTLGSLHAHYTKEANNMKPTKRPGMRTAIRSNIG